MLDINKNGELSIVELKFMNEQLKYGYSETQLWDIIRAVGGYSAETISFEKFNAYVKRKISKVKRNLI